MIIGQEYIALEGYTVCGTDRRDGSTFEDLCIIRVDDSGQTRKRIISEYNIQGFDVEEITEYDYGSLVSGTGRVYKKLNLLEIYRQLTKREQ